MLTEFALSQKWELNMFSKNMIVYILLLSLSDSTFYINNDYGRSTTVQNQIMLSLLDLTPSTMFFPQLVTEHNNPSGIVVYHTEVVIDSIPEKKL